MYLEIIQSFGSEGVPLTDIKSGLIQQLGPPNWKDQRDGSAYSLPASTVLIWGNTKAPTKRPQLFAAPTDIIDELGGDWLVLIELKGVKRNARRVKGLLLRAFDATIYAEQRSYLDRRYQEKAQASTDF